jgi:hypothetical protein
MYTDAEYQLAVERANALAELDPDMYTPEANELLALVKNIEEYERHYFPHMFGNKHVVTGNAE